MGYMGKGGMTLCTATVLGVIASVVLGGVVYGSVEKGEELVLRVLKSRDESVRRKAKEKIVSLGKEVMPVLEKYLTSKDWRERYEVVGILAGIRGKDSAGLLLKVAMEDKDERVGLLAVRSLRQMGIRIDENSLLGLLKRYHCSGLVLNLVPDDTESEKIVDLLAKRMFEEKRWQIKRDIAVKIGKLRRIDPELRVKLLLDLMRRECIKMEGGERKASEDVDLYGNGLCIQCVRCLVMIGSGALLPLIEAYEREKDEKVKRWMVIALGRLGYRKAFSPLVDVIRREKNGWMRAEAVNALATLGDRRAIGVLKGALKDPFYVRKKGGDVVLPSGYEYMQVEYPVREAAYFALLKLGVEVRRKGSRPSEYHEYEVREK